CLGDDNRQHNLDVITPDTFDNRYFVDLRNKQGVLTSDQGLVNDQRTSWIVNVYADHQEKFFEQFGKSMTKLGQMSWRTQKDGEIRQNTCFRTNGGRINLNTDVVAGD